MINEQLVDESIDIAVRVSELTASAILKGLDMILKKFEKKPDEQPEYPGKYDGAEPKPELKKGKQTLQELHKHNEGLVTMELTDPNLRDLYKEMKNKDIDFSCVKDGKGKYTLLFKAKNTEEMTNAFKRYTEKTLAKADKKAIKTELSEAKKAAKDLNAGIDKVKKVSRGAR